MNISSLIKLLSLPSVNKNLNKLSNELKDDPEVQAYIDIIKQQYSVLNKTLINYCKEHPNTPYCKEKLK